MLFAITKIDKLKTQSERAKRTKEITSALAEIGYGPELYFFTSAEKGTGIRELQAEIRRAAPPTEMESK